MKNSKGYLYGTLVLGIGTVIVKLIGALFKIPLTNILGGVGMSYFNVAYDLYYPLCALFISGVPVAVSKIISENIACGKIRSAQRLLRLSLGVFITAGILGTIGMYCGAEWFTEMIDNPQARAAVIMLSPSLVLGCGIACLRGYWQGFQNMVPTAISQIVEAVSKLLFGLWFANVAMRKGLAEFEQLGTVYGHICNSIEQARMEVLPFGAAGAVLGVSCSTACGFLYLLLIHKYQQKQQIVLSRVICEKVTSRTEILRQLVGIAIPVCLASVISNLTSFIDLISVMNRLSHAITINGAQIVEMYKDAIPAGVGMERLAAYLYGCYSGLAVPLQNLIPSLTAVIGISLLPAVSSARALQNTRQMAMTIESSLRIGGLLAFPAGFGIIALAKPVMSLLYFAKPMEVAVISPALRIMGISAIFVALTLPLNAALQAIGRADLPVKLLLIGGALKLGANFILVGMPELNIQAAPIGTLVCYLFIFCAGLYALLDQSGVELSAAAAFGKPFLAGACCGLSAWMAYNFMSPRLSPGVQTLLAICVGGIVYVFLVLFLRVLKKEDILMLPGGEKFANILAKHHLLG